VRRTSTIQVAVYQQIVKLNNHLSPSLFALNVCTTIKINRFSTVSSTHPQITKRNGKTNLFPCQTKTNFVMPATVMQIRTFADLPKFQNITFPSLSPTMTTGGIGPWRKKEGDKLSPGDVICDVQTDKATVDFESTEEGYIAKILKPEGTTDIEVGTPIAILVQKKEDVPRFKDYQVPAAAAVKDTKKPEQSKKEAPPAQTEAPKRTSTVTEPPSQQAQRDTRIFASPVAKKLATEKGINLAEIQGTGPNNRIIKPDIVELQHTAKEKVIFSDVITSEYTDIPNSQIRKIIASRLQESKQTIPHYYLTMELQVDKLLKLREELNQQANGSYKLSVNDFIIKASSLALRKVPEVNSSWKETVIRRFNRVHINVAVSTEHGLLTPIIRDVDNIGLTSISNQVKELAEKARKNKLSLSDSDIGTFTISNLGMFGIKQFTAVINPPQACILAVGQTEQKVIVDPKKQDSFSTVNVMHVTLSCDHRVVDGAVGSKWLQSFKYYIENPVNMLL